jgi:hypothetical protein
VSSLVWWARFGQKVFVKIIDNKDFLF